MLATSVAISVDVSTFSVPVAVFVLGIALARFRQARWFAGGVVLVVSLVLLVSAASDFFGLDDEGRAIVLGLKDVPGTPHLYQRTLDAATSLVLALAAAAIGLLLVAWAMPSRKS